MATKSSHAEDSADQNITGPVRKHILSRLYKAARYASQLVALLRDAAVSRASDLDILEAEAYYRCLAGTHEFEKHFSKRYDTVDEQKTAWSECLTLFSEAHVIYAALLHATKTEVFKEFTASNVDPSIRYAAYQARLPRSIAIPTIAEQHFRKSQKNISAAITEIHPQAFEDTTSKATSTSKDGSTTVTDIPTTLSWRGRNAPISDALIGQAVAARDAAASHLFTSFTSASDVKSTSGDTRAAVTHQQDLAASYDPTLTAAQDAVDAVRSALADLTKEGIPESDPRTQDLRVCDLSVNYSLISWRVGRNRVLISSFSNTGPAASTRNFQTDNLDDGLHFHPLPPTSRRPRRKADAPPPKESKPHPESKPHKLSRLKSRTVLYDSILQSLSSIRSLPGAARDSSFTTELDGHRDYFAALRCLNIAYSHSVLGREKEVLALYVKAQEYAGRLDDASSLGAPADGAKRAVPTLCVAATQIKSLKDHTHTLLLRQHGLVTLRQSIPPLFSPAAQQKIKETPLVNERATKPRPVVSDLHSYPQTTDAGIVDLTNLVTYPPKLEPVPVKPIFLDLAYNYIDYPGRSGGGKGGFVSGDEGKGKGGEQPKKRGWFGFGSG